MFRPLPILLLVAAAYCQSNVEVDSSLNQTTSSPPMAARRKGCGWANPDGVDLRSASETVGTTKFGEFPWVVAILNIKLINDNETEGPTNDVYYGAGSLIHSSVVLTSARYVANAKARRIRAGEWDFDTTKELYPYQDRDVASIRIHEDYNKKEDIYNIAILFLTTPVDLAPNVGVACLPPAHIPQKVGTRCFTIGWGKEKFGERGVYSSVLQKLEMPVVSRDKCQASYRETMLDELYQLHSSFMCAGGEPGKDTCKGDGCAPLSCPIDNEKDRYVQSGIAVFGQFAYSSNPAIFVDVSVVRDWIDDKVVDKGYEISTYTY